MKAQLKGSFQCQILILIDQKLKKKLKGRLPPPTVELRVNWVPFFILTISPLTLLLWVTINFWATGVNIGLPNRVMLLNSSIYVFVCIVYSVHCTLHMFTYDMRRQIYLYAIM